MAKKNVAEKKENSSYKFTKDEERVWYFQSTVRGYSIPDPRFKPPLPSERPSGYCPPVITFIHGLFHTRDRDQAEALIAFIKGREEAGCPVPIMNTTRDAQIPIEKPPVLTDSVSTENARAVVAAPPGLIGPSIGADMSGDEFAPAPDNDEKG